MLFGVFDGHGGREVAEYARENFKKKFMKQKTFKDGNYKQALIDAFLSLDKDLKNEEFAQDCGATACVTFVTKDKIFCANAGDSRAVLSKGKKAVPLSEDHKPNNREEYQRIQKAGHTVSMERVDGELALSRAFGDYGYKDGETLRAEEQAVTAFPDVDIKQRSKDDDFMVVACDGIWDCVSNQQCVDKMANYIKVLNVQKTNICPPIERLFDEICADSTVEGIGTDNMSAILVQFRS